MCVDPTNCNGTCPECRHETSRRALYPSLSPQKLEPHYSEHVSAMTSEGLRAKAAIAEQLAWRDQTIARLRVELAAERACWHCKVCLEPSERPRCESCPSECDDENCQAEGCQPGASDD